MRNVCNVISYPLDGTKSYTVGLVEGLNQDKLAFFMIFFFNFKNLLLKCYYFFNSADMSVSTNLRVGSVLRPRVFLHGALFFDVGADAHKCCPAHGKRRCGFRQVNVTVRAGGSRTENPLSKGAACHLSNTEVWEKNNKTGACNSVTR